MSTESVFILLFSVATVVAIAARYWGVPYTVGLVLAGLVLGIVRVLPTPHLTKPLLYAIFLPGLLFEAAFHLEAADLRRNGIAILSLAVPGVVAAIVVTTAILSPVIRALDITQGFDWRHALVFGTLITATDPIAVVAMLKTLGAPRRLSMLMEGESLLNDGTAIVFFTLSLVIVSGGQVSAGGLTTQFFEIVGLGGLLGLAVGVVVSKVIEHVNDPMVEITLTTLAAYGAFVLAEHWHFSGVIATVAAGVLCGNYGARTGMSASTRIAVETFWEYVAFALNSIVFLLIGLEIDVGSLWLYAPMILVAYAAVMLARAVVIAAMTALLHRTRERFPFSWGAVLTWGGLRGALPMVLALSLPSGFVHRDLIVNMTFGVVMISILVHGLSMAPLLRILGLVEAREERRTHELARGQARAARAALAELDRVEKTTLFATGMLTPVRREYEARLEKAYEEIRRVHVKREEIQREELRQVRTRLILLEKEQLIHALREGLVGRDVYEELLADADARLLEIESGEAPSSDEKDAGTAGRTQPPVHPPQEEDTTDTSKK
jgi:CPA1 family monovalent cation:H+ antiporter